MLAAPKHGFVFLAAPKAGSTAIQRAFTPHAQLVTLGPPSLKHVTATEFESDFAPLLDRHGYERSTYTTTCLARDPIEATLSWWRYRSRTGISDRPAYTGNTSFEEFAELVVAGKGQFKRLADFACGPDGRLLVERPFRYENLEACVAWMTECVGEPVSLRRANVSPQREAVLPASTRRRLEEYFAADYAVREAAE